MGGGRSGENTRAGEGSAGNGRASHLERRTTTSKNCTRLLLHSDVMAGFLFSGFFSRGVGYTKIRIFE